MSAAKVSVLGCRSLAGEQDEVNPYCVLAAGKQRFKTNIVGRTLDPRWDETFVVYV